MEKVTFGSLLSPRFVYGSVTQPAQRLTQMHVGPWPRAAVLLFPPVPLVAIWKVWYVEDALSALVLPSAGSG